MAKRDLDVVVFGATGLTGRQVAAYLAEQSRARDFEWGAAARDAGKLDRVLGEAGIDAPHAISADVDDPASLAGMASRTKVVLDLVGPYALYGRPVIEACIAEGAHYVDLTGEIPFVRTIGAELGLDAERAGVKIVQVSGFESLPPDLAVLLAAETARDRFDQELAEVDLEVQTLETPPGLPRLDDVVSGGTIQSIIEITGAPDSAVVLDPAALVGDARFASEVRERSPIALAPRRTPRGVVGPMTPAAFINPQVIHRTAELSGADHPFRYREGLAVAMPGVPMPVPAQYAVAGAMSAGQVAMKAVAGTKRPGLKGRVASVMRRTLPGSGFGPSPERTGAWKWGMRVDGRTPGGGEVRVDVSAEGHPGYLTTARMIGEAGLLLAEDGATADRSGCLTPAIALGTGVADRFEAARLRFSVR